MSNPKRNHQLITEWESIFWNQKIVHLQSTKGHYSIPNQSILIIQRNDEYKLKCKLSGSANNIDGLEYKIEGKPPEVGQFIEGDDIIGYDETGIESFCAKSFLINNQIVSYSGIPPNHSQHFKCTASIDSVEQRFVGTSDPVTMLLDFFLSRKISLLFPRTTQRNVVEKTSKRRELKDEPLDDPDRITNHIRGSARDSFIVQTPDFDFIVQQVDKEFLPDWAHGVQIEYRTTFKRIPDIKTRQAISEIVGFVLGTHLLKIGESHFDSSENIVFRTANNPWGDNVVGKCDGTSQPPIDLSDHNDWYKIERTLNKLVPKYLQYQKDYGLSEGLWRYWIANELAIGVNLPVLSSGLEIIAENYIKSNELTRSYSHAEKSEYKKLTKHEVDSLSNKLKPYDFGNRVVNAIKNPYNIGSGEKMKLFFNAIGINLSKKSVETEALLARNKMTHSSVESAGSEKEDYARTSIAYKTLFNRIILKVLDFDESYVDFYNLGHPNKNLNENM